MELFNKNLSYIKQTNESLFRKITSLSQITKQYEIGTNLVGQYNLLIDGKPVHSITDVETETQELIDRLPEKTIDTLHFIYGIGLGYLPDKFIEKTVGPVIVYEPDVESLYFVLSAVDFSENFKKNRLFFISDFDELLIFLDALFKYKSKVTLSVLDYYNLYHKDAVDDFKVLLKTRVDMQNHNLSFVTDNNFDFFKRTVLNIHKKYEKFLITDYKDSFKNIPAIIASAGPSLAKNIDLLKKYENNALIFCGGTSLRTLCDNDIIPDFLNVIERHNTSVHYDLPCTDKMNFITEPFADSSYLKKDFKRIFYTAALETEDSRWFLETAGKELVPFETKGTVAYHAIYTAYYLGCNPIILLGQDLAYSDGDCYAKGSKFDGLSCVFDAETQQHKVIFRDYEKYKEAYYMSAQDTPEHIKERDLAHRLKKLNENLRTVIGQNGEKLPTDAVYELFLHYIEDFALAHKSERNLINASIGGALIKGFETMPLDVAMAQYADKKLDKSFIVDSVNYRNTFDKNTILQNLKNDYSFINALYLKLEKALELTHKFKRELAKANTATPRALELYKKLFLFYSELHKSCVCKSRIGRIVIFKLYMELEYLVRTEDKFTSLSYLKDFAEVCDSCIPDAKNRINYIIENLDISIRELENNESCYTKS